MLVQVLNSIFKEFYHFVHHQGNNKIGHGHNFITVTIVILTLSKESLITKIVIYVANIQKFSQTP